MSRTHAPHPAVAHTLGLLLAIAALGCVPASEPASSGRAGASSGDERAGAATDATPPGGATTAVGSTSVEPDDGPLPPAPPVPARCDVTEGAAATMSASSLRRGPVSYYADSLHGRRTASGEPYDRTALTAASRDLPFGSIVRVRRRDQPDRAVVVRINDRGPFGRSARILDLSRQAAECLDMIRRGVVEVDAEVLRRGPG